MIYKIRETSVKPKSRGGESYGPYHAISIAYMPNAKPFLGAFRGTDEVFRTEDLYSGGKTNKSYYVRLLAVMRTAVDIANKHNLPRADAIEYFTDECHKV